MKPKDLELPVCVVTSTLMDLSATDPEDPTAELGEIPVPLLVLGHRNANCKISITQVYMDAIKLDFEELHVQTSTRRKKLPLEKLPEELTDMLENELYEAFEEQDEAEEKSRIALNTQNKL